MFYIALYCGIIGLITACWPTDNRDYETNNR